MTIESINYVTNLLNFCSNHINLTTYDLKNATKHQEKILNLLCFLPFDQAVV